GRQVEWLGRGPYGAGDRGRGGLRAELDQAAGIAGGDDWGSGLGERGDLGREDRARHLRLREGEESRAAATLRGVRHGCEPEHGNRAEHALGWGGDPLSVERAARGGGRDGGIGRV